MLNRLKWHHILPDNFSWKSDLLAALTVAIVIVPQGMAYALLAGVPPIYGLYAAFVPLIIYPLFGSSRHLSVGPVALVSIILFTGLSAMSSPGTDEYIRLALLTALVAGVIQVAFSQLRMGFLINFLSEPVIQGFTSGAATIIIFSQVSTVMGMELAGNATIQRIVLSVIDNFDKANSFSFLLGVLTLLFLLLVKRKRKKFPAGLAAIVITTVLAAIFHWTIYGVDIIGAVPHGLPAPRMDFIQLADLIRILPLAFVISLISFVESLAIARSLSAKHNNYRIHPDRELLGLGLSKMIGSFFQGIPGSGSFARSAINEESGATSGLSSLFAAALVGLILLFFTPLFFFLPKPVLGAIVISAVLGLINFRYAKRLFYLDRKDFYVFMTTFSLTLFLGIQLGVLSGIILSILLILQKTSRPHYAILGQLPGTRAFRNISRYPQAIVREDILILRYDQDIYFGNTEHFFDVVMDEIDRHGAVRIFILNFGAVGYIDSTGITKFRLLLETLRNRQIKLILTHVRGPVRDHMQQNDLMELIGTENIYLNINDALTYENSHTGRTSLSREYATQSFKKRKR